MREKKRLIFLFILALNVLVPFVGSSQSYYASSTMNQKHKTARNAVLNEHFEDAVVVYSDLLKKEDNSTVRAEYAYALALAQCYDGAIMNLDEIIIGGKGDKTTLFYISQVLKLMEYDELADVFWTKEVLGSPSWILLDYKKFIDKYKYKATINIDNLGTALQRINYLIAKKQYIQSIVIYQELIETYPDEYLPYIGFSALWESLGYKDLAVKYLQDGIEVMGSESGTYDADGVYIKHLAKLKSKGNYEYEKAFAYDRIKDIGKDKDLSSIEADNKSSKRKFIYLGLTSISKALSIEAKYGLYTSDRTSFSLGLGYQGYGGTPSYWGSMSYYVGAGKFFSGLGLSLLAQKTGNAFDGGLGISLGGSFLKSLERQSIDCRLGIYYMIQAKDMKATISIGYTYYF